MAGHSHEIVHLEESAIEMMVILSSSYPHACKSVPQLNVKLLVGKDPLFVILCLQSPGHS